MGDIDLLKVHNMDWKDDDALINPSVRFQQQSREREHYHFMWEENTCKNQAATNLTEGYKFIHPWWCTAVYCG